MLEAPSRRKLFPSVSGGRENSPKLDVTRIQPLQLSFEGLPFAYENPPMKKFSDDKAKVTELLDEISRVEFSTNGPRISSKTSWKRRNGEFSSRGRYAGRKGRRFYFECRSVASARRLRKDSFNSDRWEDRNRRVADESSRPKANFFLPNGERNAASSFGLMLSSFLVRASDQS